MLPSLTVMLMVAKCIHMAQFFLWPLGALYYLHNKFRYTVNEIHTWWHASNIFESRQLHGILILHDILMLSAGRISLRTGKPQWRHPSNTSGSIRTYPLWSSIALCWELVNAQIGTTGALVRELRFMCDTCIEPSPKHQQEGWLAPHLIWQIGLKVTNTVITVPINYSHPSVSKPLARGAPAPFPFTKFYLKEQ